MWPSNCEFRMSGCDWRYVGEPSSLWPVVLAWLRYRERKSAQICSSEVVSWGSFCLSRSVVLSCGWRCETNAACY